MSDISVAIISYNTRELLRRCIASVFDDGATDVVVVDNGSTDGSVEMLQQELGGYACLSIGRTPDMGVHRTQRSSSVARRMCCC